MKPHILRSPQHALAGSTTRRIGAVPPLSHLSSAPEDSEENEAKVAPSFAKWSEQAKSPGLTRLLAYSNFEAQSCGRLGQDREKGSTGIHVVLVVLFFSV